MICKDKEKKALYAIYSLIAEAHNLAIQNIQSKELFNFFDDLEHLPNLLIEENDQTNFFEMCLEGCCVRNKCTYIIDKYRK